MRWREHWGIGRDALWSRRSLAFQLGTLLPDWFERKPKHKSELTLHRICMRIAIARQMWDGARKDFVMGTIVHYLCDYCTYPHEYCYEDYESHARHEIGAQRRYKELHRNLVAYYSEVADELSLADKYEYMYEGKTPKEIIQGCMRQLNDFIVKHGYSCDDSMFDEEMFVARLLSYRILRYCGEPAFKE